MFLRGDLQGKIQKRGSESLGKPVENYVPVRSMSPSYLAVTGQFNKFMNKRSCNDKQRGFQ